MSTIFAFGDSITYGSWDVERGGWVHRLRRALDQRADTDPDAYNVVYNLGVPGETTDGLVSRLKSEVAVRESGGLPVFIFAYGANDIRYIISDKRQLVELDRFVTNLKEAIQSAQELGGRIILLTAAPVIEELTRTPNKTRSNADIKQYNQALKALAQEAGLAIVDVHAAFDGQDLSTLLIEDGLHPSSEGHEIIYRLVLDALREVMRRGNE